MNDKNNPFSQFQFDGSLAAGCRYFHPFSVENKSVRMTQIVFIVNSLKNSDGPMAIGHPRPQIDRERCQQDLTAGCWKRASLIRPRYF